MEKKMSSKTNRITDGSASEIIFRLKKYNCAKMFSLCEFLSNKMRRESAQNPPALYNNELK